MPSLQTFQVKLPKVVLEHLLFVLHGLEQTGARFWRVQGEVSTLEYVNPVAVEGSLCGMWTHAGETGEGRLTVRGTSLDPARLHEALSAAIAPGEKMDIVLNPE